MNDDRKRCRHVVSESFVQGVANALGMSVGVFAFLAFAAWMAGLL